MRVWESDKQWLQWLFQMMYRVSHCWTRSTVAFITCLLYYFLSFAFPLHFLLICIWKFSIKPPPAPQPTQPQPQPLATRINKYIFQLISMMCQGRKKGGGSGKVKQSENTSSRRGVPVPQSSLLLLLFLLQAMHTTTTPPHPSPFPF